ncbi:hypothetical protein J4444_01490 [Candidatus Woesearchaeota archaeon]|nr:hypothetical protein [Candidatus Woesearchaeota archaeon]
MRLTTHKIEEILIGILGIDGTPLIKELQGKSNISEFDLATKTKKDIKVIRKMLYLLYNSNLVGFTRKKDKQKGWYIYYWTLIPDNVRFSYFKIKREQLVRLKSRLEEEQKEIFFVCESKCVRLNFDQSIGFDFRCPECGKLISQDNNEAKVKELIQKIAELEQDLTEEHEIKKEKRKSAKQYKKVVKKKIKVKKEKSKAKKAVKKAVKKTKKKKR